MARSSTDQLISRTVLFFKIVISRRGGGFTRLISRDGTRRKSFKDGTKGLELRSDQRWPGVESRAAGQSSTR